MRKSKDYDPNWHYLKRLQRWYANKCENEEEWNAFSDSLEYEIDTGIHLIIFKGYPKDKEHVLEFLRTRPLEE